MQPTLRPSSSEDKDFLLHLYASTRMAEIASFGWNEVQKQAFVTIQFNAQQRWYETAYPEAEWRIITLQRQPVGRMIVHRGADAAVLVDIALLPENRGRGLGTALLRELLDQCRKDHLGLRLQVLKTNPAQRLYARLGFSIVSEDALYLQMEWQAGQAPSLAG